MRARLAAVALGACVAFGALDGATAYAQVTAPIEAAREVMESGDSARAREMFTALTHSASLREAATAVYYLAVMADEEMNFAAAVAGYRDFLARDPGSRFAARAQARVDDLMAHSEGGFAPLVTLERVRRDEQAASSLAGLRALDRAIAGFPPGNVRAEARLLVGEGYLSRVQRPADAARVLHDLAGDPSGSQELRALAAERLVEARAQLGQEVAAAQEVTALRADPEVQHDAAVLARRAVLRRASWTLLALTLLAGVTAVARAALAKRMGDVLRAWRRPLPLVQLGFLTLGGGTLAKLYDEHEMSPFLVLGGGALAVYLSASAWNVTGHDHPAARAWRGLVCLLAVLAVSFLAMDTLDPMMLEGISL